MQASLLRPWIRKQPLHAAGGRELRPAAHLPLSPQMAKLAAEAAALRAQLDTAQREAGELAASRAALSSDLEAAHRERAKLVAELEALRAGAAEMGGQLQAARGRCGEVEGALRGVQDEAGELRAKLNRVKAKVGHGGAGGTPIIVFVKLCARSWAWIAQGWHRWGYAPGGEAGREAVCATACTGPMRGWLSWLHT